MDENTNTIRLVLHRSGAHETSVHEVGHWRYALRILRSAADARGGYVSFGCARRNPLTGRFVDGFGGLLAFGRLRFYRRGLSARRPSYAPRGLRPARGAVAA